MATRLILCPVDFSDASRHATRYATALARAAGARIIGLHVHQPALATIPGNVERENPVVEPMAAGSPDVQRRITEQFIHDEAGEVMVVPDIAAGEPADAIAEHALIDGADLIVIGTRGAGGLQHLLLGSVTEDVIRKAGVPVLAVPPHAAARPNLPFRRVLCATDFSASSLAALEAALRLLVDAEARVTVLHVIDDPAEYDLFVPRPYDVHRHTEALEAHVRETLTQLTRQRFEGRPSPDLRVAHGSPSEQILGAAAGMSADLIVMGVHGRRALDLALFGSTTNDAVRRALCPVLTARR